MAADDLLSLYMYTLKGEPVPLMEVRGNEVLAKKFNGDVEELYLYCIKNNVKWEDVLGVDLEAFDNSDNVT